MIPGLSTLGVELLAALRSLRRSPGFTLLTISMVVLGIGANVAVFSIFQTILLRPLPFAEASRLVGFSSLHAAKAITQPSLSISDFRDFRERSSSHESLAASRPDFVTYLPQGGDPDQLICAHVTEDFFLTLGVAPLRGRHFRAEEFSATAPRTTVLSFAAWRNRFNADPTILGRTITLNDEPTTIVGVMPESFREPEFVDLWFPFPIEAPENLARDSRHWSAIGRLKPGTLLPHAQAEGAAIAATLEKDFPGTNRGWTIVTQPLRELRTGGVRNTLLILVWAVGLVLVVACVNLANLMLARGVARMPEFAVRLSLGASPGALARGVLLECMLLALAGGALGAALVVGGLPVLAAQVPPGLIPRVHEVRVDGVALGFALALSIGTGIVFGAIPAWQVRRANVNDVLKTGNARGVAGGFARRVQATLIAAQVALTLIVLAGAGLLMRSLLVLQRADIGFDPANIVMLRIAPGMAKWTNFTAIAHYYERILDELRRVPGVETASLNCSTPLTGITLRFPFWIQGRPRLDGSSDDAVFSSVDGEYFKTLRLALRRGRAFDGRDHDRAPLVCIINAALARRMFPDADPIGQRLQIVPWLNRGYREIIGVVADVAQNTQADPPTPQVYVPSRQSPWMFTTLLVRTDGKVGMPALQAAARRADPALSMNVRLFDDAIKYTAAHPRLRTLLFGIFGATALVLSAFGIYASMAFAVNQRVREIGVRMALGATPGQVLVSVLGRASRVTGVGVIVGLAGATPLAGLLRGLLYGVSPLDPVVLGTLALFLPLVALLASFGPALRAARLNPVQALAQE